MATITGLGKSPYKTLDSPTNILCNHIVCVVLIQRLNQTRNAVQTVVIATPSKPSAMIQCLVAASIICSNGSSQPLVLIFPSNGGWLHPVLYVWLIQHDTGTDPCLYMSIVA